MKSKFLLGLALILCGGWLGCRQSYPINNEAERIENNREILRLATLIDSNQPPVTAEMLQTGEFDGKLFDVGLDQGRFSSLLGTAPKNTQAILIRLMNYSLPPEMYKSFPNLPPTAWVGGEFWVREKAADVLIAAASPAVVPIFREWLTQGLAAAEAGKPCRWGEVAEAAKGLGEFHDATIVPLLVTAWQNGVFEKKIDPLLLGDMEFAALPKIVVMTLAEMPSPIAKNILLEAMNDKRFDEYMRYPIAAALVRLDDQSARDLLLDGLDKYLAPDQDTRESSRYSPAFYELEYHVGDAKLISAIEARAAVATRKRLKLVLPRLVEWMRINSLSADESKRIAEEEKSLNRRIPAIEVLGETGKSDALPFLESLAQHTNEYRVDWQRDEMARVVKAAIRNVRLHNWQQLENKP